MKQYLKLMKEGVRRIFQKKDFSIQQKDKLGNEVFQIWKGYLLKIKKLNLMMNGIFKKHIFTQKKHQSKEQQPIKQQQSHKQEFVNENDEKVQQKITQEQKITYKRQRKNVKSKDQPAQTTINKKTKFRSYYLTSVKPLIPQSQQQRRNDKKCLTKCQKHFLSYLIEQREVDDEFLQLASSKYIKMLQILRNKKSDSYLKQKQIQYELRMRNKVLLSKKNNSLLLILLIDIIICLSLSSIDLQQEYDLPSLLKFYQSSSYDIQFINKILLQLSKDQEKQNHNIPLINYQLIYAIIYIACLKIGKCITISQILYNCGLLEIKEINYTVGNEEIILPPIYNEEYLSCIKIRRTSHLLKQFLSIEIKLFPLKWSQKWCLKLRLQNHLKVIQYLNNMILNELFENNKRIGFNMNEQLLSNGKLIKYYRWMQLQQDIACLAGIFVYLKLSHGLTLYPYLVNVMIKQLQQNCLKQQQDNIQFLKNLLQNKKVFIQESQNRIVTKSIPIPYHNRINLTEITQHLTKIALTDKQYSRWMLNKNLLKVKNISDLNYLSTNDLLSYLNRIKSTKLKKEQNDYQIILRYNQNNLKIFCRQGKNLLKKNKNKSSTNQTLNKYQLHQYLSKQIHVIKKHDEEWIKTTSNTSQIQQQQCLLDYPSSNYQIMLEYTNDNMILAQRQSQVLLIELLCLNICSYAQLSNWISKFELNLKDYQI